MDPVTISVALGGILSIIDHIAATDGEGNLPESLIETRTQVRHELAKVSAQLAAGGTEVKP